MIKRQWTINLIIVTLLSAVSISNAHAVEREKYAVYVNSGISIPERPIGFRNHWGLFPGFGLGLGYPFISRFSIVGSFNYNRFPYNNNSSIEGDGDITILAVSSCLKGLISKKHGVYFTAGIGFFRMTSDNAILDHPWAERPAGDIYESNMAIYLGLGMEIKATKKIAVFFELNDSTCFTVGRTTEYLPVKIGLAFR